MPMNFKTKKNDFLSLIAMYDIYLKCTNSSFKKIRYYKN